MVLNFSYFKISSLVRTLGLCSLVLLSVLGVCQQSENASVQGTIRDSQGQPLADVVVQLLSKNATHSKTARTDGEGHYELTDVQDGIYGLTAAKAGFADAQVESLTLVPHEHKGLDLTLGPAASESAHSAPQFFDEPKFTVSGVTDPTTLGGHGSGAVIETREALAKKTVSLTAVSPEQLPPEASAPEKVLKAELVRDPGSFEINRRLGQFLLEHGHAKEAVPYLERAANSNLANYEPSYELARAHAASGNYAQARNEIQALLPANNRAELHHLLGDVQEKLGNSLESVRQFQVAAEMDPSEANLFDWGAEVLLHHAPQPAVEILEKGHALFPRSARMLIALGVAWFADGNYEQGVQRICEASDLNPEDSSPYLFLGEINRAETLSSLAIEKLRRFATLQPHNPQANYYYAVALWKKGKSSPSRAFNLQIESLLQDALRSDPRFAPAELQLGILHSEQGQLSVAVSDYERAIALDPQMDEAHYRLAQAYRQLGQPDKAKEELRMYEQLVHESFQKEDQERRQIKQFVYTLKSANP